MVGWIRAGVSHGTALRKRKKEVRSGRRGETKRGQECLAPCLLHALLSLLPQHAGSLSGIVIVSLFSDSPSVPEE